MGQEGGVLQEIGLEALQQAGRYWFYTWIRLYIVGADPEVSDTFIFGVSAFNWCSNGQKFKIGSKKKDILFIRWG